MSWRDWWGRLPEQDEPKVEEEIPKTDPGHETETRPQGPASARLLGHSTGRGLRSQTLRRLGRLYGNQQVQRMLADTRRAGELDAGVESSPDNAQAIQAQLGDGHPLDGSVKSRVETALGSPLGAVHVHTDDTAAKLSAGLGARAFTVGSEIAFARGEYQPGTLAGDALIAHELAHVVQQDGAVPESAQTTGGMERDADRSAMETMVSMWALPDLEAGVAPRRARPRLRSGLALRRCTDCAGKKPEQKPKQAQTRKPTEVEFALTPPLMGALRSIEADPFKYQRALVGIYLDDAEGRRSWIVNWFGNAFPQAWAEVGLQYEKLRPQIPPEITKQVFEWNIARWLGDKLHEYTKLLYQHKPRFRRAVEEEKKRRENRPLLVIPPDARRA